MQPESTHESQDGPQHLDVLNTAPTSQHGQHRDDDLQASLHAHSGELRGEPESPTGGNGRDATRADASPNDGDTEAVRLRGSQTSITPPPRNRITDYENALSISPRKSPGGPLFEVIKGNRRPDDKTSAIAKLPSGKFSALMSYMLVDQCITGIASLTLCRDLDPRHCSSFAE